MLRNSRGTPLDLCARGITRRCGRHCAPILRFPPCWQDECTVHAAHVVKRKLMVMLWLSSKGYEMMTWNYVCGMFWREAVWGCRTLIGPYLPTPPPPYTTLLDHWTPNTYDWRTVWQELVVLPSAVQLAKHPLLTKETPMKP